MVLQTGGGGGFGNPLDRDPVLVAQDISYGYVTREGAERDYGVVITAEDSSTGRDGEASGSFTPRVAPPSPPSPEGESPVEMRGGRLKAESPFVVNVRAPLSSPTGVGLG